MCGTRSLFPEIRQTRSLDSHLGPQQLVIAMTKNKKKSFKNRKRTDDNEVVINKDGWTNRPSMPEREGEWTTDWTNAKFEAYYRYFQKILPEEEWDTFMDYMRKTLPTTFRLPAGKL